MPQLGIVVVESVERIWLLMGEYGRPGVTKWIGLENVGERGRGGEK